VSIDRIWFRSTADGLTSPPSGGWRTTSVGYRSPATCDVSAATMVIGLRTVVDVVLNDEGRTPLPDLGADRRIDVDEDDVAPLRRR